MWFVFLLSLVLYSFLSSVLDFKLTFFEITALSYLSVITIMLEELVKGKANGKVQGK